MQIKTSIIDLSILSTHDITGATYTFGVEPAQYGLFGDCRADTEHFRPLVNALTTTTNNFNTYVQQLKTEFGL